MGRRSPSTGGQQPSTGTPSATPTPSGTPAPGQTATPTPTSGSASIDDLLRQAQQSSNATQQELDRLRAILEAIQKQLQTQP